MEPLSIPCTRPQLQQLAPSLPQHQTTSAWPASQLIQVPLQSSTTQPPLSFQEMQPQLESSLTRSIYGTNSSPSQASESSQSEFNHIQPIIDSQQQQQQQQSTHELVTKASKTFTTLTTAMSSLSSVSAADSMVNCINMNNNNNINNNNITTEEVVEKFDSLGLDFDTSELLNDINLNSMTMMSVMMDSGQSINLGLNNNSRDNLVPSTLQTPQMMIDSNDEVNRNLMANPSQMQRLHAQLMQLENNGQPRV